MTKNSPLVSIGMPVYNGEKTVWEALDSLLAQDFKDFELIISDNASTDNTAEICHQYAARDSRVRFYRNEANIGPTANFNRLVHLARGKYFMWAADDDWWEPSYISCMVEDIESNHNAVLSFCRFDHLWVNEMPSKDKQPIILSDNWSKIIGRNRFSRLLRTCFLLPWAEERACYIYGLIRKDILLKCGGMENRIDVYKGADIITLFHLLYYGKFVKVEKLLFHRRYDLEKYRLRNEHLDQKSAERSWYSMAISRLSGWHEHYRMLSTIIKENSFQVSQKIVLFLAIYTAELLYNTHRAIYYIKRFKNN